MWKSQKGMSLIEIMVALVVFGIGITMAIKMLPESNSISSRSRNITTATNLASEKLEELMGFSYNYVDLSAGTHNDPDNPINTHYRRSWDVIVDSPVQGMKRVSVSVTFPTAKRDSTVTLDTFITTKR
jgi:prepilin-type N-terminal cleavage/methylation domain-containing protein